LFEVRKINKRKISREIAEQIISLVNKGNLQPGERLPTEKQLEEMFGVSRASVREALSALEMAEIIEMRHGEGSFVRDIDLNTHIHPLAVNRLIKSGIVYEMLQARKAIEGQTACLAAQNATAKDLEEIKRIIKKMEKEIKSGQLGEESDHMFHLLIAKAGKNTVLYRVVESLSELIKHCQKHTRQYSRCILGRPREVVDQHIKIFAAISKGRPAEAKQAMLDHLEDIENVCQKLESKFLEEERGV